MMADLGSGVLHSATKVETVTLTLTVRAVSPVAGTTARTSGTEPRHILTAVSDCNSAIGVLNYHNQIKLTLPHPVHMKYE